MHVYKHQMVEVRHACMYVHREITSDIKGGGLFFSISLDKNPFLMAGAGGGFAAAPVDHSSVHTFI